MNFVHCCANSIDGNEDDKDQFYERLESTIAQCPGKGLVILVGELNTWVGIARTRYEDILGRHGHGERNKNEGRFANLHAFNKTIIGSTILTHKCIHKATSVSLDHATENQIDHNCISLWQRVSQLTPEKEIRKKQWRWIGYTQQKPLS